MVSKETVFPDGVTEPQRVGITMPTSDDEQASCDAHKQVRAQAQAWDDEQQGMQGYSSA